MLLKDLKGRSILLLLYTLFLVTFFFFSSRKRTKRRTKAKEKQRNTIANKFIQYDVLLQEQELKYIQWQWDTTMFLFVIALKCFEWMKRYEHLYFVLPGAYCLIPSRMIAIANIFTIFFFHVASVICLFHFFFFFRIQKEYFSLLFLFAFCCATGRRVLE